MKQKLLQMPLLKLVLPLIAGIFLFDVFDISWFALLLVMVALFLVFLFLHFSVNNPVQKKRVSLLVYFLMFSFGAVLISSKHLTQQQQHFSTFENGMAVGTISQKIKETEKSYKTVVSIHAVIDSQNIKQKASGNLLIYFSKDSSVTQLEIGDELLFNLSPQEIEVPKNPFQFDYKNYLKHKSIFHQQYLNVNAFLIHQKHKNGSIKRLALNLSMAAQHILTTYISNKTHLALSKGILLGISDDIDDELYNAFAYTGILHILSVSGLHVGIIYGILMFLLGFIKDKSKRTRIFKALFVIAFIWTFAFVTGLSSACVRAAILFTLLTFGKENKAYFNNINLLAGSALLQILIDANVVFDVGFQLSYLAMLGLFIFYKPIYALFYVRNKWLDNVWKLWAASLAAQVFTIPLSIYYFGNFPLYFLLANVFAIPLSTAILWLCIAMVFLSWIPYIGNILGFLLDIVMRIFIALTEFVSKLPYGKINTLHLHPIQLAILFLAVVFFTFYVEWKKSKFLLVCLTLCLIAIGISYVQNILSIRQDEIIFYSLPKKDCIAYLKKDVSEMYISDSLTEKDVTFNIQNVHRNFNIHQTLTRNMCDSSSKEHLLNFRDKTIFIIDKHNQRKQFENVLKVDYIFLCDNIYLDIEQIRENFEFQKIVIGCSNDYRHQKIFEKLLIENKLPYHNLNKKSLIIELE